MRMMSILISFQTFEVDAQKITLGMNVGRSSGALPHDG